MMVTARRWTSSVNVRPSVGMTLVVVGGEISRTVLDLARVGQGSSSAILRLFRAARSGLFDIRQASCLCHIDCRRPAEPAVSLVVSGVPDDLEYDPGYESGGLEDGLNSPMAVGALLLTGRGVAGWTGHG
jgi:hypothetical protein